MRDSSLRPQRVSATRLSKDYDGRRVVDEVSFALEPGTVTVLLGANGAGKSTTLRLALGLLRGEGRTEFGGMLLSEHSEPARVVGAHLGGETFHPRRSARDHMRVVAAGAGVCHERVDQLLDAVGLLRRAGDSPKDYSTGMRQSLGLAAALLADPAVLVLDEPAGGLDPEALLRLRAVLRSHADRGGTVVLTSHLLMEAETVADRVLVLEFGRVIADDAIAAFIEAASAPLVVVRADDLAALSIAVGLAGGLATQDPAHPALLTVSGLSPRDVALSAAAAGTLITELRVADRTLEQAFFAARRAAESRSLSYEGQLS